MLFYVFTSVFQKMGPRGSVLMLLYLGFGLEVQSGISRSCTSARAEEVELERRIRASSISLHCFTVRSSGGMSARAEISPIQYFYSTPERKICTLERVPLLHVRSSGETCARTGLCFLKNLKQLLKVHLCILISSWAFLDLV